MISNIDSYRAYIMRSTALDYRMNTMSEELKDILFKISDASEKGLFRLKLDYRLNSEDVEFLEILGYVVFVSPKRKDGVLIMNPKTKISWN